MWKRFLDDLMSIAICPALAERIVADNADKSIVESLWIGVTQVGNTDRVRTTLRAAAMHKSTTPASLQPTTRTMSAYTNSYRPAELADISFKRYEQFRPSTSGQLKALCKPTAQGTELSRRLQRPQCCSADREPADIVRT